jgi:hypothetical protein
MPKCKVLRASLAVVGDNITLTLPDTEDALTNREILRFYITSRIPEDNPLGTVSVIINGTTFPLTTILGNSVRTEQLRSRYVYTIQLGAETPNFTMKTCLPETSFVYPAYAAPANA